MKILYMSAFICISFLAYGQNTTQDTIKLDEVIITSNRFPISMKDNPGAVSYVPPATLSDMPKNIGAEEALRFIPGVRTENQHDGERVHISIRGQGILTERGLRGIGVMLDGIPVNDPSGFAPDLYDVDWATVHDLQVLRGPAAGLYGSSATGGMISISTRNGGPEQIGGTFGISTGSHGFFRTLLQLDGTKDILNYRLSYSRTSGDGYRAHQAFWGNQLYAKLNFTPSEKLYLTAIISHSDYFQQNPEGLNLSQLDDPRQANPDACPFNEYQKTNRTTIGMTGTYGFNSIHNIQVYAFYRPWRYKETSNKCAEYRNYTTPGGGVQYNLNLGKRKLKHHISLGADLKWQQIDIHKLQSAPIPERVESIDETNIETDTLLANQVIVQNSVGIFALYRMELGKLNIIANIRYDGIGNELNNKMYGLDSAMSTMNFHNTSFRLGASYNFNDAVTAFANFSQGFLPPSTEELASNPLGYSGFNTHLVPATANSIEAGARGYLTSWFYYDITGFLMYTQNDFFRFKQTGRGNQEVFYGNAGNSRRLGVETYFSINFLKNLNLQINYTYGDFQYTSATIDSIYTDTAYVLTTPPAPGQFLPNSPVHQLYAELVYRINKNFRVNLGVQIQSKWAIYTDAEAYNGELDPDIYQNWQKGFNIYNARFAYLWHFRWMQGELSLSARNFTGASYMAYTEPDPDGNSYHPAPKQEFFVGLKISFD